MQVVVDGLLTNYQIVGKGKVVLLLHGWGDNISTFDGLSKALSANYLVISLDLPGFGGTDTPTVKFTLEKYSEFIVSFLHKLNVKNIYSIIGHSNGGAIGIKATATGKIEVQKLVLLASSGVRSEYNGRKKVFRLLAKTAKYPTKLLPNNTQKKIKKKVYKKIGSDLFVAENMQETFRDIISEDLVEQSKKVKSNTLLIYGSEDEATPVLFGERFNNSIKNSKFCIVSGAGHFVHQTNSNEVEKLITEFLEN